MNAAVRYLYVLVIALQGCSATVLHVPDRAPEDMQVTWIRVDLADLPFVCRQATLNLPAGQRAAACAQALPGTGRCTIYTSRDVTVETVGHEVAHCYLGAWHH